MVAFQSGPEQGISLEDVQRNKSVSVAEEWGIEISRYKVKVKVYRYQDQGFKVKI